MTISDLLSLAKAIDKVACTEAMGVIPFDGNHNGGVYVEGTHNGLKRSVVLTGSLADICGFLAQVDMEIWEELPAPDYEFVHNKEIQHHRVVAWDLHGYSIKR